MGPPPGEKASGDLLATTSREPLLFWNGVQRLCSLGDSRGEDFVKIHRKLKKQAV